MKTIIRSLLFTLGLLTVPALLPAADTFYIGVAPHTSARVILEMYQPLRLYLEKTLERPAEILTAPDFDEFARRALKQEYDIAITTGHQARLLQTDAKYLPLLTYKADFMAVALVQAKGSVKKVQDLAGKNVLGLSPSSLVTLWGQHWLAENKLKGTIMKYVSASDSLAQLVIAGEAATGFTSLANFQNLAPDVQAQLHILAESQPMVGRVYMLNGRDVSLRKKLDATLSEFAKSTEGLHYFATYKLGGYRPLSTGELKSMDKYAAEVRKLLKKDEK